MLWTVVSVWAPPVAAAQTTAERQERVVAPGPDSLGPSDAPEGDVWRLVVDGQEKAWDAPAYPPDSLRAVARAAVRRVQMRGRYLARLDSAVVDTSARPPTGRIYIRGGPVIPVGRIRFEGNEALSDEALQALMDTRPERPLRPKRLEHDLDALLACYERLGFPLAQVRVKDIQLISDTAPRLAVTLSIDEGGSLQLRGVEVEGSARTRPGYVARIAGLEVGDPLTDYDPNVLQERLRATGLFEEVGTPELHVGEKGQAVIHVSLIDESPGAFDLALGYLPPSDRPSDRPSGSGKGRIVGNGHLVLRNLFGGGRTASVQLDRRPGRTSSAEVQASLPYVGGLPLSLRGRFEGVQRDTTYGKQRYELEVGYRLFPRLRVGMSLSREVTRPGAGGARLDAGRQRVPRADARFAALRLRYRYLGRPQNPRRGFALDTRLGRGRKARTARRVAAADTARRESTLGQARLRARARLYLPVSSQQVVAVGADGSVLQSEEYDRSDLFFLGGATSLRGYDEDRFRGNVVGRALVEYRYLLGRRSRAYAFFDLGYVRRPALIDGGAARSGVHPGYGLGVQFDSQVGLVNVSYGLNDEDGLTAGRVHLGLSVGL